MADQLVADAVSGIQDEGIGGVGPGNEDWGSAGLRMMLAQAVDSDSYVRSDSELTFAGHDGTNDTVDVTPGVAYLDLTGVTVTVQSGVGDTTPPAYDTTLPTMPAIPVIVPSTVSGVAVQDATLSQLWLAYDTDGTGPGSAGSVYVRSDDTGSVTAPSHPSVELGSANPDNAGADVLANRFGSPTFDSTTVNGLNGANIDGAAASTVPVAQGPGALAMESPSQWIAASETDDASDITKHTLTEHSILNSGPGTLVDVSGSGYLLGGFVWKSGDFTTELDYIVDGTTTSYPMPSYPSLTDRIMHIYPVKFESSIQLVMTDDDNDISTGGEVVGGEAWVKQ